MLRSSKMLLALFVCVGASSTFFAPSSYANTPSDIADEHSAKEHELQANERNFEITDEVPLASITDEVVVDEDASFAEVVHDAVDVEVISNEEFALVTEDTDDMNVAGNVDSVVADNEAVDAQPDALASDEDSQPAMDESFEMAHAVTTDDLEENRGTSNPMSSSFFFATSAGNSANNTVSEGNKISDSAFANTTGIATSIQNSGNNVVIQSSTIVNVEFASNPLTPQ